jgi:methanogenic corrinoid protein MtbC1
MRQPVQMGDVGELANLRQDWVQACLTFDEPRAEQTVSQAFALFPLNSVVLDVLLRGLAEIGEGWYHGEVAVQQEHFASTLAVRRLQAMIAASPMPTRAERIVLACPPGEQHTVSLLVINLFLRRQGWEVIDLGANVPLERLESIVASLRPQLLIASAQHLLTAQTLQTMSQALARMRLPLAFGGSVFNRLPAVRRRIAGYFLGEGLSDVTGAVQEILHRPSPPPEVIETPRDYIGALENFRERLPAIEAEVLNSLEPQARELIRQAGANDYMAEYLSAALALGDINFLDGDLSWIRGLLVAHHLPDRALLDFLQVYRAAIQKHLDWRGAIIVEWFQQAYEAIAETVEA